MNDYLSDFKLSIDTGKLGKAKTLLTQLPKKTYHEKGKVLEILALMPDTPAFELLSFLTSKAYKNHELHDQLIQLTIDRSCLNHRFILIVFENSDEETIFRITHLLKQILSRGTDKEVLLQVIKTAGMVQLEMLTEDVAEFIFFDDADLKLEAIKALERIDTPLAYEKLKSVAKTSKSDQNILDALEAFQKKKQVTTKTTITPGISANGNPTKADEDGLFFEQLASPDFEKRFEAFMVLCNAGPRISSTLPKLLKTGDHDLTINILRLIARILPDAAINDLFAIVNQKKVDDIIKFTAYIALGEFPGLESAESLLPGLSEPVMFVRMAAVATLEKNLSESVCTEIKNRIESDSKKGKLLVETILDARAEKLIEYLLASDTFSYIASNYLTRKAPVKVLNTFIEIMERKNRRSSAENYRELKTLRMREKRKEIFVISSYEAILSTYSKLIFSAGLSSTTFTQPKKAIEAVAGRKPAAIICDLFFPDMTGMDFAREVREIHSRKELPILLTTLQKNLDQTALQKEFDDSGVNALYVFPAKTDQIESWIVPKQKDT